MASVALTSKRLFAVCSLDAVLSIDSVEGAHVLDGSRAVSAFSTNGKLAVSPRRSFKGRPRPGLDVNFLPTQQPRNGSSDRDSPQLKCPLFSQYTSSSAESLIANARVRHTNYFVCNVLLSTVVNTPLNSQMVVMYQSIPTHQYLHMF